MEERRDTEASSAVEDVSSPIRDEVFPDTVLLSIRSLARSMSRILRWWFVALDKSMEALGRS